MDISIVIVSWNAKPYLRECLQSIVATKLEHTLEVIVVDNASTDGSPEMVARYFPQVHLIRNQRNLGFAAANNAGIRASQGRCIALLNSDIKVLPDCLDQLVEYLDQHPCSGLVGPRILNADGTVQSSCRKFPSLWNNFCEASALFRMFPRVRALSTEHMLYFKHDRVINVDVLVGCFWMIPRQALEAIGLLDEDFFIYSEDVDWCRRCWQAGWHVNFYPAAQAIHYRAASSANDPARFAVEEQRALLHYWDKHHTWAGRLGIRCILLGRYCLRYGFSVASRLLKSSTRDNDRRLLVSRACMRALFAGGSTQVCS